MPKSLGKSSSQRSKKPKEKNEETPPRIYNIATEFYLDSCPDWEQRIRDLIVPAFGILHDKDLDATGQPKKPHVHVLIMFDTLKSERQIDQILNELGSVGKLYVTSLRAYARYLTHKDDADKYQYDISEVISFAGADYSHICSLTVDRYKLIKEMCAWCRNNDCYSFADLMDYADIHKPDWYRILCDNSAYIMKEYLKSKTWTIKTDNERLKEQIRHLSALQELQEKSTPNDLKNKSWWAQDEKKDTE